MSKENGNLKGKKMLVVLAHPDDESFGMGGTIAYYVDRGVDITYLCATRGEAGSMDEDCLDGFSSKAERRESELRCAVGILGVKTLEFLGYRDSGMPGMPDNDHPNALINQPVDAVAERITHYIRKIRPDIVVTHDPVGGYHHPDHIAVHRGTLRAFEASGDPNQFDNGLPAYQPEKLYYHVFPRGFFRIAVRLIKLFGKDPSRFGRNGDINLELLADDPDYPPHVTVKYNAYKDIKQRASECHASQLDLGSQSPKIFNLARYLMSSKDDYMQASPPLSPQARLKDLFEG